MLQTVIKSSRPVRLGLQSPGLMALLLVCVLMGFVLPSTAAPQLNPACPPNFFTNVASRLLSSQLKVNLNHIEIYPTNQYTPAVHRLLQVTANILDATTTNYYPSVFRPLFWKTNEECNGIWQTNIYVVGYQYVQEPLASNNPPILNTPLDVADAGVPFGLSGMTNNIYSVPWIIGAKKGFPNFNGLEDDNCFFIQRELQFNRSSSAVDSTAGAVFPFNRIYTTNQMYVMGASNILCVEHWNSYEEDFNDPVTVFAQETFSFGLSNDAPNFIQITNTFVTNNVNLALPFSPWQAGRFVFPLGTNVVAQNLGPQSPQTLPSPNNEYIYFDGSAFGSTNIGGFTYAAPCFIPASANPTNYVNVGTPPLPHLFMQSANRVSACILDTKNPNAPYILDYVQLEGVNNTLDLNQAIADQDNSGLWSTNAFGGGIAYGVNEQFVVSSGYNQVPSPPDGDGGQWSGPLARGTTQPYGQQAFFAAFFTAGDVAYDGHDGAYVSNTLTSIQAAYTPIRLVVQRSVYQANDPLVHYLSQDLYDFLDSTNSHYPLSLPPPTIAYLGQISDRYMPWGQAGSMGRVIISNAPVDNNPYNLSYKDPLVVDSDAWEFPTNQSLNGSWLGQIHRGTPWQTIYLKSSNILTETVVIGNQLIYNGIPTWQVWTGDTNVADAVSMAPAADWQMAGLLASLFNTNNESSLFSANDPNPNDWENLLNGMTALTNDVPDFAVEFDGAGFATLTISSAASQAAEIANGIESTHMSWPGQLFATPGDIFSVPQLSDASPYLNIDPAQVNFGISDLAYEAIPDQLLPLLRVDSIGSMTTANGQVIIQFTGDDNHAYAIQVSPNLVNWTTISTNCPVNGIFTFTNNVTANAQFYRTVLLP